MGDKMVESVVKSFRVTMNDEEFETYQRIKEDLGLRADAEVLRHLIKYYHKKEIAKE
jgi:hypothetical protein